MIVPVTRPEYEKGEKVFAGARDYRLTPVEDDETSLASFVSEHECRAVVVGVEQYLGPLYDVLPEGGIILRFGVGTDSLDRAQTRRKGILVANTPGALDRSVAEHCIFLIGALVRHIGRGHHELKSGSWVPRTGDELADLKLAILGLGRIGSRVAQIAHQGFGMETLVCELLPEDSVAARLGMSQAEMRDRLGYSLWTGVMEDALAQADVVTVHLPLVESTRGLFDAARFAQFRMGSLLVNTSRGGLVVESDLAQALRSGRLAGAALDVYQKEPYEPVGEADDLRQFPNVLMTPHIASNTRAANKRMARMVVENLRHWAQGEIEAVHIVP